MKTNIKKALIILLILIVLVILMGSRNKCFAASQFEGNVLSGYDGSKYQLTGYFNGYCYNSVGWLMGTLKHTEVYEDKKYHLIRDGTKTKVAYCLEHRVDTNTAITYTGTNIDAAKYMKFYPEMQRKGIIATAMYAPQYLGEASPVLGTNTDDWYWASQVVIWEFQEGIRRSLSQNASTRYTGRYVDKNGAIFTGSNSNHYYQSLFENNNVDGRSKPALKCYNWIINNLNNKDILPSFVSSSVSSARMYSLNRINSSKYQVTINDTNNTFTDIFTDNKEISINRSGNLYTVTTDKPFENGLLIKGYKVPDSVNNALIVWDSVLNHRQTLMTGTNANLPMYFRVKGDLPKGNLLIHKTAEDGFVGGVEFEVTRSSDGKVYNVTTDDMGYAKLENLICGDYQISEVDASERYIENADKRVSVEYGKTKEILVYNELKKGNLLIHKTAEDGFVGGIEFEVTRSSDGKVYNVTTDDMGYAKLENLICGDYQISEVDVPIRYIDIAKKKVHIEYKETQEVIINNKLKNIDLTIEKYDEYTGNPLEDAGFIIYDLNSGEEIVKSIRDEGSEDNIFYTDANGKVLVKNILKASKEYVIKEVSPPSGYKLDEVDGLSFEPTGDVPSGTVTFNNKPYLSFRLSKITEKGNPIKGAFFEILKDGDEEPLFIKRTDENGEIFIEDILVGDYEIKEVKAPLGYVADEKIEKFSITEGDSKTYEMTIVDKTARGSSIITKKDVKGPLHGVEFTIYADEDISNFDGLIYGKDEKIETILTDDNGICEFNGLLLGKYYLIETKELKGYEENPNIYKFEINKNEEVVEIGIKNTKIPVAKMVEKEVNCEAPKTGDENRIYLYISLTLIGLSGFLVAFRLID
ncbi:MAG TPA: SpaA isopeptide-forming pilin-related protein [Anaerovoracaceae bacterium]|nr:SpaA isopeptide-forming pilin-related protein [Anaerovoracaceae bacterium]